MHAKHTLFKKLIRRSYVLSVNSTKTDKGTGQGRDCFRFYKEFQNNVVYLGINLCGYLIKYINMM